MSLARKYLAFVALVVAWCGLLHSQAVDQQGTVHGSYLGRIAQKNPKTSNPISVAQKQDFIRLLGTLPGEGEFYSQEAVKKAGPYLAVLFALTEEDIQKYDFYAFGAISRGLCDQKEYRGYAILHFAEIRHPLLRLLWAAMLFDKGESSKEIVHFLKSALKSRKEVQALSELTGPDFQNFRKRVLSSK